MPKKIHSSRLIPIALARDLLIRREQEAWENKSELSFIQKEALTHAVIVSKSESSDAEALFKVLIEKFKLSELSAIAITDILPTTIDELRQLLDQHSKKITTEELEEIMEIVLKIERKTIKSPQPSEEMEEDEMEDYEMEKADIEVPLDLAD